MDKIKITPFFQDQQNILFYGRRVGYCGTKPGMPICFLHPRQCQLTDDEKREVVAFVVQTLGSIRPTKQTEGFLPAIPELEHDDDDEDVNTGTSLPALD